MYVPMYVSVLHLFEECIVFKNEPSHKTQIAKDFPSLNHQDTHLAKEKERKNVL